jgi:hypothetical protein
MTARWLIVGHGSVGSFVARRIAGEGVWIDVLDPAPRIPVDPAHRLVGPGEARDVDYVVSCVGHGAREVPGLLDGALRPDALLFDWNSVSPATKLAISDALPVETIDVALLDSLDAAVERPNLAISGPRSADGAQVLAGHGFNAQVVGAEVGQAARMKYLRSIFMKGIEGLTVEYAALASALDPDGVIRASIESNLGAQCMDFLDLLLVTNRHHSDRRGRELQDAIATLAAEGVELTMAPAAVGVLEAAAAAWQDADGLPAVAAPDALARHLQQTIWR